MEIGGDLNVQLSGIHGYLFIPNANIGGNFFIAHSSISGTTNAYLSRITGTLRIGELESSGITRISYGDFRSVDVNGDLIITRAAFRALDLGGSDIRGRFHVDSNLPLRPSFSNGPKGTQFNISIDSKSIYPIDSNLSINVAKKFAYDGLSYFDLGRHIYGIFDSTSRSYATNREAEGMGFTGHTGTYAFCALAWNSDTNDYDVVLQPEDDALAEFVKYRLKKIPRPERIQFAKYCLTQRSRAEPGLKAHAEAFLKPGQAYRTTRDQFAKEFADAYGRLFVDFPSGSFEIGSKRTRGCRTPIGINCLPQLTAGTRTGC
jgi:hypothetical protein